MVYTLAIMVEAGYKEEHSSLPQKVTPIQTLLDRTIGGNYMFPTSSNTYIAGV